MAKKNAKRVQTKAGTGASGRARTTKKARSTTRKHGPAAKAGKASSGIETKPTTLTADSITSYPAAVKYLLRRPDVERMRVIRDKDTFKLDRMRELLAELGNPQDQIRTIHVAGTVGKGSTCAMVSSMLRGCDYAVGCYSSPHLTDLRERIQIDGQMIPHAQFVSIIKSVAQAADSLGCEPTFFEIMTAMAFKYFADEAVDIAIIEAGLGGRLDSTNVIQPEVTAVTRIAMDHQHILGNSLEKIAAEKAGIFKRDVPALIFDQSPEIEEVFRAKAEEVGAPLKVVNKDIEFSHRFCSTSELGPHTRVCLYTERSRLEHLPVPLAGEHQASNCGLALAIVDVLKGVGFECPDDRITQGLTTTTLTGRMQMLWESPRILVDGAHNPEAVSALMRCVGAHMPYDSMVCVFGCCQDKDVGEMLDRVNLGADKVIFTRAQGNPRAAAPEDLQRAFVERSGKMSQTADTLPEALELATRAVSREDLICVTGSFYLVGEAMKHLAKIQQQQPA
ncbi:MAG: folylpolyglutamate synthase/dihydrofolate synthase family protein [Planctomycetota bacterium]|nr:folylpolyglutamate synthase/dihydrofolate synthase family protein [Planctomycetota bacterium]